MDELKFVFKMWPDGTLTISLDREYCDGCFPR